MQKTLKFLNFGYIAGESLQYSYRFVRIAVKGDFFFCRQEIPKKRKE